METLNKIQQFKLLKELPYYPAGSIYKYDILTGWYSGSDKLSMHIDYKNLDYYKIGSYKEELGPLNCKETNQALYGITHSNSLNLIKMYK